ncbi:hypothetical protein F5B20DRAFT_593576 [Whalleya microplaca]|nr:hypothetical protein F5B20DRAFT_593576 [Whalleya microplaca]
MELESFNKKTSSLERPNVPSYAHDIDQYGTQPSSLPPPPPYIPGPRQLWQYHLDKILPKLRLPLAIFVGICITAGTTFLLVKHVQHLVANATVSSDSSAWMHEAKTKDYDPCYLGCDDCDDPDFAYDACVRTSTIKLDNTNIVCDGRKIWNWADRYPEACLSARGKYYRDEALETLKQNYRNQLAIIILTILGGVVGGWVIYRLMTTATAKRRARALKTAQNWPGWRNIPPRTQSRGWLKATFLYLLALCGRTTAYPCTGHDRPHDVYLTNSNHTIFAHVHGWLSNCYENKDCYTECIKTCIIDDECDDICTPRCASTTYTNKNPRQYVEDILPRISQCGFTVVPFAEKDTHLRLANPGIERNWRVKIDVNGYNVTSQMDTDPMIWCLYDIGGS